MNDTKTEDIYHMTMGAHMMFPELYAKLRDGDFDQADLDAAREVCARLVDDIRAILASDGPTEDFHRKCGYLVGWEQIVKEAPNRKAIRDRAVARQQAENVARFS